MLKHTGTVAAALMPDTNREKTSQVDEENNTDIVQPSAAPANASATSALVTPTSGIATLPAELILSIIENIPDSQTLSSLTKASWQYDRLAKSSLYRDVTLKHVDAISSLLWTLHRRPEYVDGIRTIQVEGCDMPDDIPNVENSVVIRKFPTKGEVDAGRMAIAKWNSPTKLSIETIRSSRDKVKGFHKWLNLLLMSCPNVSNLRLCVRHDTTIKTWDAIRHRGNYCHPRVTIGAMPKLESLDIVYGQVQRETDISPWLMIRNVIKLSICNVSRAWVFPRFALYPHTTGLHHITELRLHRAFFRTTSLIRLFQTCSNLQVFSYSPRDWNVLRETREYMGPDEMARLIRCYAPITHRLERIRLMSYPDSDSFLEDAEAHLQVLLDMEAQQQSAIAIKHIGSTFHDFPNLKDLEYDSIPLFGTEKFSKRREHMYQSYCEEAPSFGSLWTLHDFKTSRIASLKRVLPATLECLTVRFCRLHTLSYFEELAECCNELFPNLQEIYLIHPIVDSSFRQEVQSGQKGKAKEDDTRRYLAAWENAVALFRGRGVDLIIKRMVVETKHPELPTTRWIV